MCKKTDFTVRIIGTIGGSIWWPYGAKCSKEFRVTCDKDDTLRDAILRVTNDGDFESCDIVDGFLQVTQFKANKRIVREFDLTSPLFTSIQDCFTKTPEDFYLTAE